MAHKTLKKAIKAKKDEFYTQLTDIEKELRHYKDQFKDKVVYATSIYQTDIPSFLIDFYAASAYRMLGFSPMP